MSNKDDQGEKDTKDTKGTKAGGAPSKDVVSRSGSSSIAAPTTGGSPSPLAINVAASPPPMTGNSTSEKSMEPPAQKDGAPSKPTTKSGSITHVGPEASGSVVNLDSSGVPQSLSEFARAIAITPTAPSTTSTSTAQPDKGAPMAPSTTVEKAQVVPPPVTPPAGNSTRTSPGGDKFPVLDPAFPLVLLPVRIETRFDGRHLLIRVYPDEIFADSHEPALTKQEREAANVYWTHVDDASEARSWQTLVDSFTAPRAAWIVRESERERHGGVALPKRAARWTRAVEARLLPACWFVQLTPRTGQPSVHVGSEIRPDLALSLNPSLDPPPPPVGEPREVPIDDALRWTVDFKEALNAGMALRIDVGSVREFARVVVFGVRATTDAQQTAAELSALFTAHRHTAGLSFLRQGTPTNNSTSSASGFSSDMRDAHRSREAVGHPTGPGDLPASAALSMALGLSPETFTKIPGATLQEQGATKAMQQALWPATLGYFLAQRVDPSVDPTLWDATRHHFVHHVRGRGPLPAFRVGRVPYGVLPVGSLSRWQRDGQNAFDKKIVPTLLAAREVWRAAWPNVPRVGKTPNDPERDLLEVLGMDASAREIRVRAGIGPQALLNAASFLGIPQDLILAWCRSRTRTQPRDGDFPEPGTSLRATVYSPNAPKFTGAWVCDGPLREDQGLTDDYVTWLRTASLAALRDAAESAPPSSPLLRRLLRHSLLLEYLRVARELAQSAGELPGTRERQWAARRDPELVGDLHGLEQPVWEVVDRPGNFAPLLTLDAAARAQANRTSLPSERARLTPDALAYVNEALNPFAAALDRLRGCPTAELERLLSETLDLCSHRLDAWITSLFTERLGAMRAQHPTGCHVGAYAWVENLIARNERPVSEGFIHAPSLDHAAAAAVLRNAYLTHDGQRFAVDLSSKRVQDAQEILDRVRIGQSLAQVLGWRVERALHVAGLDVYIDRLRARFPLVSKKMRRSDHGPSEIAGRSVVDGLAFYRATDFLTGISLAEEHAPQLRKLHAGLGRSLDAVSDLLGAEAVFQLVRGNTTVATANLDALGRGQRPPDPEVVRSPRSGVTVTHRVGLALPWREVVPPAWEVSYDLSVRAQLEPALNAWLAQCLGAPDQIYAVVTVAGSSNIPQPVRVSLRDLRLSPLDVLALSRDTLPPSWRPEVPSGAPAGTPPTLPGAELDRRILSAVFDVCGHVRVLEISHARHPEGRCFPEVLEVARLLAEVIHNGRPMVAADAAQPTQSAEEPTPLHPALLPRVKSILDSFVLCCTALQQNAMLRDNLQRAARFGVIGAFPVHAWLSEGQEAQLKAQARWVAEEMHQRLVRASGLARPEGVDLLPLHQAAEARLWMHSAEVLRAIFAAPPVFLAPFLPRDPLSLETALAQSLGQGATPLAIRQWLYQSSRVRPALSRWRKLGMYLSTSQPAIVVSPSVGPDTRMQPLALQVAQFAPTPHPRWAALAFPLPNNPDEALTVPPSGTISLALSLPEGRPPQLWAGIIVDEWVELIPNAREVTGIAFHYDDPGAEAGQTVLIATPPVEGVPWTAEMLAETLTETLELAKLRAVDAERLGALSQFLPAIHLANNTEQDTVSTDFSGSLRMDAPSQGGSSS